MCSRFHIDFQVKQYLSSYPGYRDFKTGDIRPGDLSPVMINTNGRLNVCFMRWGFHPEPGRGNIFNARAESVEDRLLFKSGFEERRAVVPADSFYEWNSRKEKSRFEYSKEIDPMYLAGIWRKEEDGNHFVVLTTEANESMRPIHDRMPLILEQEEIAIWCTVTPEAKKLLKKKPKALNRYTEYEQLSLF